MRAPHAEGCALLVGRSGAYGGGGRPGRDRGWRIPSRHRARWSAGLPPRCGPRADDAELATDGAARSARLPTLAWQTARDALRTGPVLVQVPRRGYLPALACVRCRRAARCATCARSAGPGVRPDRRDVPVVRSAGDRVAVPGLRGGPVPRRRGRAPGGRPRSWAARSPACPSARRGATGSWHRVDADARPGRGDAGRRAGRGRRLRGGAAAGRVGAAGAPRPARRRGGAAALARGGGPGAPGRRRWSGRRARRLHAATRPGAAALGPCRRGRARARRPAPAALPARGDDGGAARTRRRGRRPAAAARASSRLAPRCSGPRRRRGRRRARSSGSPLDRGRRAVRRAQAGQAVRSARKAGEFVTVTVDPADLG